MEQRNRGRILELGMVQPGPFCFALLGAGLCGLVLLIVRLGEGLGSSEALVTLLMLSAPLLCLRPRRD